MYVCPHCHKQVKDLAGHIKRKHPDKVEDPFSKKSVKKVEKLEIKKPKVDEKKEEKEDKEPTTGYHCLNCGGPVRRGQNPCPHCGGHLDWAAVHDVTNR